MRAENESAVVKPFILTEFSGSTVCDGVAASNLRKAVALLQWLGLILGLVDWAFSGPFD